MSREQIRSFKQITLDQWATTIQKQKQEEVIENKNDLTDAFFSIVERHEDLNGKEYLVEKHAAHVTRAFREGMMTISHLQLATACLAFLNHEQKKHQIWVVPAGQGKSRIHAALTFLFLKFTDYDIYVVFQNDTLKKTDTEHNEKLQKYCDASKWNYSDRVKYQTDLSRKQSKRHAIMIIDESDERMFRDLGTFYKKTKADKVFVICLTATPYEGDDDGIQKSAIDALGYKIYKNSDKEEDYNPKITKQVELGTIDRFRTFILHESDKCGVLVYANGREYEQLKLEENITPVDEVDSYLPFETMDAPHGPRYPVFLISEEFGNRGLNFRAASNPLGITLLILGKFPDPTTRLQTLKRVGRFTDKCSRVQDTTFP